MKSHILCLALLAAPILTGCETASESYARQHPELPAQHRAILRTGKVPDGTAIAGMTREQVQLAMGVEPTQYTKVDGLDAWVYVRKKLMPTSLSTTTSELDHRDNRNRSTLAEEDRQSPQDMPQIKTTVIFQGNVAVRAEVTPGGL